MKKIPLAQVQALIERVIESARLTHEPTSEYVVSEVVRENKEHYSYLENESLVYPDEVILTELQALRQTYVDDFYLDTVKCQNPSWDHRYGSYENDCFYFLAVIRFYDLIIEVCFSTTAFVHVLSTSSNSVEWNGQNDDLTERERILIHCYKSLPAIERGQSGYQDYMTYARTKDRISYAGDSKRKASL